MIYPGLAPAKRKVVPANNFWVQRPNQLTNQPYDQTNPEDILPPLPTLMAPRREPTAPQPSRTPASSSQSPQKPKRPVAECLDKLDTIANDFRQTEFNMARIFAEAVVFFGIIMLNWSVELRKPQRTVAIAKIALVVLFFGLHPFYCTIATVLLCVTYGYLRLSYRLKKI